MIGVVADDITGSNDIGIMFGKNGYVADIYPYESLVKEGDGKSDVLIADTHSRFDSKDRAYQKVYQATKELQKIGAKTYFNKTCSVFRGNIGAEFDAMLDALDEPFAAVILGFPKNGRITKDGIHYVHGVKLEDSAFKDDPVHPMDESDLINILQKQTKRKVTMISHRIIRAGARKLKEELKELKQRFNYVILDVLDQRDLKTIAEAVKDQPVICGASAIAEELSKVWDYAGNRHEQAVPQYNSKMGILCAAGSLTPQTKHQIDYMRSHSDAAIFELSTPELIDKGNEATKALSAHIIQQLKSGKDVIVHTSHQPEEVKKTKRIGAQKGWTNEKTSLYISSSLSSIVASAAGEVKQNGLIVAGGDTSAAVCETLGIKGLRVLEELQPGLPSCITLTDPKKVFILKSGSFGSEDFIMQAFQYLKSKREASNLASS
ncbi:uncharacterized protein YgbK (DUF1537 family) [Scopulibacillus darangshiensis]|uniref:Uncharacterized protein YgbK (DUF1537 family) n=1 Tax=Scopulibacillus darangshiensis TaxID=442528 RepID=A0A4V6NQN9_9BACL|nr:four-carbon acid sugar kinase family protein [Scopulibacillus darangshiensis]TCP29466.1 uncharacterized protein YgbK (DUF1537 family) [Scopulibacillus darangshiensis]